MGKKLTIDTVYCIKEQQLVSEYFLQRCPKDCTKKILSKNRFTAFRARITVPKLSDSALC